MIAKRRSLTKMSQGAAVPYNKQIAHVFSNHFNCSRLSQFYTLATCCI